MKRGDIYSAGLGNGLGSEQGGFRPVIIIQNNKATENGSTVTVVSITSAKKKDLPTHFWLKAGSFGLKEDSIVLVETIRSIDKKRCHKYIGSLDRKTLKKVDELLKIHLALA